MTHEIIVKILLYQRQARNDLRKAVILRQALNRTGSINSSTYSISPQSSPPAEQSEPGQPKSDDDVFHFTEPGGKANNTGAVLQGE